MNGKVYLTQYLMPAGNPVPTFVEIEEDYAFRSKMLVLSCEVLTTGKVALYGRKRGWDEDNEICLIADNSAGENCPVNVLKQLIDQLTKGDGNVIQGKN